MTVNGDCGLSPAQRIFDVRDLRAVITGAAGGLGFALAEVLAESGASVTLADVDAGRVAAAARTLEERGARARSFVADVVFANAGIASTPGFAVEGGQELDSIHRPDWDRVLGVNLNGVIFTMMSAAAVMKRQGSGRIVVTSSIAGLRPEPVVCYGYVAAKAAILNVVRQAALELAPHGVLVNAICPGPFKGTLIGGGVTLDPDPETERMWTKMIPLGRMAVPDELKGLALLLASPASSFMTGAAFVVDGGSLVLAG